MKKLDHYLFKALIAGICIMIQPLDASAGNAFKSQAEKQAAIAFVDDKIHQVEATMNAGLRQSEEVETLKYLKTQRQQILNTPVNPNAISAISGTPLRGGIPPDETAEMQNELRSFAQEQAAANQQQISDDHRHYSAERDRIIDENAALDDQLDARLAALDARERSNPRNQETGPSAEEIATARANQTKFNDMKEGFVDDLVAGNTAPLEGESESEISLGDLTDPAQNALDRAKANPESWSPGDGLGDYPASEKNILSSDVDLPQLARDFIVDYSKNQVNKVMDEAQKVGETWWKNNVLDIPEPPKELQKEWINDVATNGKDMFETEMLPSGSLEQQGLYNWSDAFRGSAIMWTGKFKEGKEIMQKAWNRWGNTLEDPMNKVTRGDYSNVPGQ